MIALLALLLAAQSFAAVTVKSVSTTATQAIIAYVAPDNAACTLEVSEAAAYTPLVHDVNTSLFASSNLDSRTGNITAGRARIFVVGSQSVEKSGGRKYSRALAAYTEHFYRITCGGDTATGSFRTANIPWGNTRHDSISGLDNTGDPAQPDLDGNDRSVTVVDPRTGAKIKRIGFPRAETSGTSGTQTMTRAFGAAWTNPSNAINTSGTGATYAGASSSDLLAVISEFNKDSATYIDGINANVTCAETGGADLQVALMINGVGAYGKWNSIACAGMAGGEVHVGDDPTRVIPGNNAGVNDASITTLLRGWLTNATDQVPTVLDMFTRSMTCDTSGTTVKVRGTSGLFFSLGALGANSHIIINGTAYTFASIQSSFQGTLNSSAGTQSGVACSTPNFGLVFRNASGTGTVEVRTRMSFATGLIGGMNGGGGSGTMCSPRARPEGWRVTAATNATPIVITTNAAHGYSNGDTVTLAEIGGNTAANGTFVISSASGTTFTLDGSAGNGAFTTQGLVWKRGAKEGFHCGVKNSQYGDFLIFWIAPEDGEVRYLGPLWIQIPSQAVCSYSSLPWDTFTSPNVDHIYCVNLNGSSKPALYRAKVVSPNRDVGLQVGAGGSAVQAQWQWSDLMSGSDLQQKLDSFEASYDPAAYAGFSLIGIQQSKIWLASLGGNQDSLAWISGYNPSSGNIEHALNTWSAQCMRWCGDHTIHVNADSSWLSISGKDLRGEAPQNYNGWFFFQTSSALASSGFSSCETAAPGHPFGTLGNWCSSVTITQHPRTNGSHTPATYNLQDLRIGDVIWWNNGSAFLTETSRILSISGTAPTITLVIQRGFSKNNSVATVDSGWFGYMVCTSADYMLFNYGGEPGHIAWWDYSTDTHGTNTNDLYGTRPSNSTLKTERQFYNMSHWDSKSYTNALGIQVSRTINDIGPSALTADEAKCPIMAGNFNAYYGLRYAAGSIDIDSSDVWCLNKNMSFGGIYGLGYGNAVEQHVSLFVPGKFLDGRFATNDEFMVDARPMNPIQDYDTVFSLVGGKSQTYQVTTWMPNVTPDWKRHVPIFQLGSGRSFRDVSGPGSVLADTSADNYSYCIALGANECVTGSTSGRLYFNVPQNTGYPINASQAEGSQKCIAKGTAYSVGSNLPCIALAGSTIDTLLQARFDTRDNRGQGIRRISSALVYPYASDALWNTRPIPSGNWLIAQNNNMMGSGRVESLLVSMPPLGPKDSRDRSDFIPFAIPLASVPAGTDNVIVEFGYNSSFHCASRVEACVAVAASVGATPFYWASESFSGLSCSSGCTPVVPVVAGRVLYYRVVYRNAGGGTIATGATQVTAVN